MRVESALQPADWTPLEARVAAQLGLRADDTARLRMMDAASERMRRLRLRSLGAYLEHLDGAEGAAEIQTLAQALTIGESYFLRGADHFAVFAEQVVPERLRVNPQRPRLRVLSAGCSSGEEIYSLAIVLADQFPQLAEADLELVGIDITEAALEKARRGVYTPWSLRDVPLTLVERHFRVENRRYELSAQIRGRVRFELANLIEPRSALPAGPFDAIFCRNVLIYFTPAAMRQVIARFEALLAPGGYLFLGHSESLRGLSRSFRICQGHDSFYYQRLDAPDASASLLDEEARRQYGWTDAPALESPAPAAAPAAPTRSAEFDQQAWQRAIALSAQRVASLARPPAPVPISTPLPPQAPSAPMAAHPLALEKFAAERYPDCLRELGEAGDLDAGLLRAAALIQLGRLGEAQALCERLRAEHTLNADAAHLLALCREQFKDLAGAREQLHLASYLDAEFAAPQWALARIARRAGDTGAARRALKRALQLLPHETPTRITLFGGGFSASALAGIARSELASLGVAA